MSTMDGKEVEFTCNAIPVQVKVEGRVLGRKRWNGEIKKKKRRMQPKNLDDE